MKKYYTFPDLTKVEVYSVLNITDIQAYICYIYEDMKQYLWVSKEGITNE